MDFTNDNTLAEFIEVYISQQLYDCGANEWKQLNDAIEDVGGKASSNTKALASLQNQLTLSARIGKVEKVRTLLTEIAAREATTAGLSESLSILQGRQSRIRPELDNLNRSMKEGMEQMGKLELELSRKVEDFKITWARLEKYKAKRELDNFWLAEYQRRRSAATSPAVVHSHILDYTSILRSEFCQAFEAMNKPVGEMKKIAEAIERSLERIEFCGAVATINWDNSRVIAAQKRLAVTQEQADELQSEREQERQAKEDFNRASIEATRQKQAEIDAERRKREELEEMERSDPLAFSLLVIEQQDRAREAREKKYRDEDRARAS